MRKEMFVLMVIGFVVFSAAPANAFSLGGFWGGVKEKIGLGEPETVQMPLTVQEQTAEPQPQPPFDASGRIDTSVMNRNQHQKQVASRIEVMTHNQGSGLQIQVQNETQERERVHLANKAGLLGKIALWGKEKECERWGGFWHWEADKVGCSGRDGTYSCSHNMIQKAAGMCADQGATFVCNVSGIYCAYT